MVNDQRTALGRPARGGVLVLLTLALTLSAGLSACGSSGGSSGSSAPTKTGRSTSSTGGAATTVTQGSDAAGTPTTSEASTGSSETTSAGTNGSTGTGPKDIQACKLLSKADASKLSGLSLTKTVQSGNNGGELNPSNQCTYLNNDGSKFFLLAVSQRVSKVALLRDPSDKTVTGLGDVASFSDAGGLTVLSGSTSIEVTGIPQADAVKVAKAVLAKL